MKPQSQRWIQMVRLVHEGIVGKKIAPWSDEDRRFLASAMTGEAGECLNIIKKEWRGDGPLDMTHLHEELVDVRTYLVLLVAACGMSEDHFNFLCNENVEKKLKTRWPAAYEAAVKKLTTHEGG